MTVPTGLAGYSDQCLGSIKKQFDSNMIWMWSTPPHCHKVAKKHFIAFFGSKVLSVLTICILTAQQ